MSSPPVHLTRLLLACPLVWAMTLAAGAAHAADGFHVRYSLYGGLGGEIFSKTERAGWVGGVAFSQADVAQLTGNDGRPMVATMPGGTVPLASGGTPYDPSYPANPVAVASTGTSRHLSVRLGHVSEAVYAGARMVLGVGIGYGVKDQFVTARGLTPGLNWPVPGVPGSGTRNAVTAGFDAQYQGELAALAAAESGRQAGVSDLELSANWVWAQPSVKWSTGASLIMPVGKYSTAPGPHMGYGNFYTLRPNAQVVYLPHPDFGMAAKLTLGLNTTNRDNHIRSGNWSAWEAAAGYMTRIGPVGVQLVHVQQFQDDRGGDWGANRYSVTNAGVFFITKVPVIDTALTFNFAKTLDSRNAKVGRFSQIRLSKAF